MLSRSKKPKKFPEQDSKIQVWFVTFADLMGLMVSFFVMMLAFSTQDVRKLQIFAGSMRDAFGEQFVVRHPGKLPSNAVQPLDRTIDDSAAIEHGQDAAIATKQMKAEREFATASASLRRALQDIPELTEVTKNIIFQETSQSLALEIVDHFSRPMFRQGSAVPYDWTRVLIEKLAVPLKATALRISIVGHTSSTETARGDRDVFELSVLRADAVRRILKQQGLPTSQLFVVAGKGDREPLFSDDPTMAANRRVTIALMYDDEALPPNLRP
uniref:OmpA/MotB domain protein n=1 Tax=Rhodopseudomonas palustris (strain BisA53) TaxID=316055 RepID=Q07ID8_RHOP5